MISPFMKLILRPILSALIAQMDRLITQIRTGQTEEAITTVEDLRKAIETLRDKYLS